jgi:hypothetical protein
MEQVALCLVLQAKFQWEEYASAYLEHIGLMEFARLLLAAPVDRLGTARVVVPYHVQQVTIGIITNALSKLPTVQQVHTGTVTHVLPLLINALLALPGMVRSVTPMLLDAL